MNMIKRIKKSFCILLALALTVTMLLPVNSVSSYAADDSSDDSYDTYEKFYEEYLSDEESVYVIDVPASGSTDDAETQLANAMQMATYSTPVLINLTADIEISSGSKSSSGLYITKGSTKTKLTTVAINGNGYSIKAADGYTESAANSALIYMNRYTQLVLTEVTLDGNQLGRCIYSSSGNATIRMYKDAVVTNGAAGYTTKSGNGIYLYYSKASSSYNNYLYMYEGSSITNCIGSTSWYSSATGTTITNYASSGSAIYAGNTYLYLYGKISGCTVADTSTGIARGTIYLANSSYAYIYDGAEISNNSVISSANTDNAKDGGAFYIYSGYVYMYGGTISNNTAQNGGAVYAYGGRFYLYGGTVSGNTAQEGNGGAVYTSTSGTVGVSADSADVQITGNTAVNGSGAGIYNRYACSIIATSDYAATVTGNYDVVTETDDSGTETETSRTAGDVFDWTTTTSMALAGNVSIGRIYVVEDQTLTLESALTGGSIGFYLQVDEDNGGHALEDNEELVVVTAGDDYALTYSDLNHFSSENTAYRLAFGTGDNAGTIVVVNDDGSEITDLSEAYVTAEDVAYTGSAQETNITVLCDGNYLTEGTDFNVIYQNNTEVGTATATIQGIGSYTGSTSVTFEITAKDIGDDDITVSDPGSYEILTDSDAAAAITPAVEVTYGDLTLEEGTGYEVSYADNTAPGTATITLTGIGSYTGTRTVTFTITAKETEENTSYFMVTDEETLNTALAASYDVILFANDIEVENEVAVSRGVTIDGNGFTLSATQALSSESYNAILTVTSGTLTLQNITVAGGTSARDLYIASGAAVSLESTATLTGGGTGGSLTTSGTSVYNGGTLNLNGCTVKDSTRGSSIYNAEGAILNMYDGTLVTNLSSGSTTGMIVNAGTFNMYGGTILAGYEENLSGTLLANTNYGRLVHNTGTFVMDGGTINGLLADGETYLQGYTGMVHNYDTGTMTMNGGTIQHYSNVYPYITSSDSANKGGTVMVSGSAAASFTMNGGTITENTGYVGAGVFVSYGSFTMNNGSITGNTSTGHPQDFGYMAQGAGAGVFVMAQATDESSVSASFTMNGGTISENEAYLLGTRSVNYSAAGAGVFSYGADVTLNGGTISGNSVTVNETAAEAYPASGRGAGVYLMSYGSNEGSLTLAGTEISGNGIYTAASGAEATSEKTPAAAAGAGVYVYDTADADVHPALYLAGEGSITVSDDVYLPTAYTYFTAKTTLTGRSVAVSYSVPDTEAVGGRTVLAYADGLTGSDKDAACFTNYVYVENGTQYAAEYDSDANVVRIPTITVIGEPEVTITDYTADESYFYTGEEIIPEIEVKVTVAVTSGEEEVVTLTPDAYEVECSNNINVTDNAVMVIKSTGAYEFDDVTVNFKITKAESQTISFMNSDIEEAGDGTLSLDTAYLEDVDFGAESDLGADVALSFTVGDDCVDPGDASDTEYIVATLDDDGNATGSYTMNTVGTITVTAAVAETNNYVGATATLTLNIAKADQVIVETSDEISDPVQQSQTGYFRLTGTVYTWVDTTFTAYRSYTSVTSNSNSGGQLTPGFSTSSYTDTDHPTGATINLVTDDEDVAYAVADGESTERDDTGTWIYMAHIGTAHFTVTAGETDYYNAATLSSGQNWSGNQATLYVTVEGLEQNISGVDMTVGSGTAQALEMQPNEVEVTDETTGETTTEVSYYYYDAASDDVAVSFDDARSGLVFTPHSDVVSDEDVTIDYYNWSSSSVSQTGDGLTYAETVSLAISDDGKSIIVTPKAAGTVQFNVYLAASGDADRSSVAHVRLTITKSEQTITTSPDDSTVVVDGTILTCMDDPDPIALHASTTAYGGVLTYKSSDTSVAAVDSSGNVTITGYGSAVITISATGIKGYEDATLEVPIRTTQHTVVEDSVTFAWSDDYSSCVAYATCADCGAELELDCDVTSGWEAAETDDDEDLTEYGTMTYTAIVTFDGLTYTDVQTVETEICTHDYHATSYRWSLTDDGYNCTGIFACAACGDIQTATAAAELTSDTVTCSTDGAKTYTAELTVGNQTFTRTLTLYEEAAGEHEYGDVTFDWSENEDGSYSCTATRTCIYAETDENCAADADSTQTVACTVTAAATAATCTEDGEVTYTAEAFFPDETAEDADAEESTDTTDTTDTVAGTTVTDTKTVAIAATGHSDIDASKYELEWSGDAESGYSCTLYFVCTSCGERFPTSMNRYINCTITEEITEAATCTEEGTAVYTASAAYAGETIAIPETQTAVIAATGHSYAAETDLGTGVTTYTCEACGDSYTAEETAEVLVYLEETLYTYEGTAIEPSVAVIVDGTALAEGTDYTVAYEANTDEGTATVTVTGTGSYAGTATKTFLIQTEELTEENTSLSLDAAEVTYTGSAITPAVTVTDADGNVLAEGTDYEVVYSDNTEAGTATVTVVGIGNYSGSVTAAFTIAAVELNDETASLALEATEYIYTGSAITPAVTVTDADGSVLVEGTDYEVAYSDNTEAGTAAVTVTGIGNYTGTLTGTYTVKAADTLVVRRGNTYYFSYTLKSGAADKVISYGRSADEVYFGDWDGDGIDTPCVRRGNAYYFSNSLESGSADEIIYYGTSADTVLVGDWNGDGYDTLAVRRGNAYYFSNSIKSGSADEVIYYGTSADTVLVGDWDGNGYDTLAVRRGNAYYFSYSIKSGSADEVIYYGTSTDTVLIGDWDGDGYDTLMVRRGNAYYISNAIKSGSADQMIYYGRTADEVYAGRWN